MILCLGTTPVYQRSMVFERVRHHDVNRAVEVHDYASGKSVNVARVLGAIGGEPLATGFVGGDRGEALRADLTRAGVRHDFVTVAPTTRQCVTVIDRGDGSATELVEEAGAVAAAKWDELGARLDELLPAARALVLSGSLPPGGSPPDFYASCLRRLDPARPIPVVIDARGEPLRHALKIGGFTAKLNRDELAATVGRAVGGGDDELLGAMREAMPPGGRIVVTLGGDGAAIADESGAWRLRVPRIDARSAVGSGDAFAAGLALGLLEGRPLPDACRLGAACGAANAMSDLAGFVRMEDVRALEPRVTVEVLGRV